MEFSEFESTLYVTLADLLTSEGLLQAYEYEGGFRAGHFQIGDEDPIEMVFSFPKELDDCYFSFTDGDPKAISKQLSSLQRYNEEEAHLCDGHTIPTEDNYMNSVGWVAYLVTAPIIAHENIPTSKEILDRDVRFHLVIPLNQEEYDRKLASGYDALLDLLDENQRDIVAFNENV
jgi:hypothetical protein